MRMTIEWTDESAWLESAKRSLRSADWSSMHFVPQVYIVSSLLCLVSRSVCVCLQIHD